MSLHAIRKYASNSIVQNTGTPCTWKVLQMPLLEDDLCSRNLQQYSGYSAKSGVQDSEEKIQTKLKTHQEKLHDISHFLALKLIVKHLELACKR